uniref:Uncharacterized protein n=1 Tax=Pseudomonas phage Touem01 TaxID=3138548 RepID=A0AAU6W2D5_9VIRU
MNKAQDNVEAAELQSWLVGNARAVRPANSTGLMGWALAALRAQSEEILKNAADTGCVPHTEQVITRQGNGANASRDVRGVV